MLNSILRHAPGVLLALVALAAPAAADGELSGTFTLTTAEAGREGLDVGGTWNGLTEVSTGDTVEVLVVNTGDDVAYDLDLTVTLPTGFSYAAGTAAGIPGISAVQTGTTLEFTFPLNTDIAAGANEAIEFGLTADPGTTSGTYTLVWDFEFGITDGASDGSETVNGSVVVVEGATTTSVDQLTQTAVLGDIVSWEIEITSSGFGAVFDAEIDVTSIAPVNAGNSLEFVSLTETSPGGTGTVTGASIVFPYLASGDVATVTVTAEVTGCSGIEADIVGRHRADSVGDSKLASVAIDVTQPMITLVTPNVTLDFLSDTPFDGEVQNNGIGAASSIVLDTNLESLQVTVANLSADWAYNAGTGEFSYTANSGVLASGVTTQLDFDLQPEDACGSVAGGGVVWRSSYVNECGDPFATPIAQSTVGAVDGRPSVGLGFQAPDERLTINEAAQYTLEFSWEELSKISTDPIVISQVLPVGIENVAVMAPSLGTASCPSCDGGDTIQWSIMQSAMPDSGTATLVVTYTAPSDPCLAGMDLVATASTSVLSEVNVAGDTCPYSSSSEQATLLTNAPTGPFTQTFNVDSPSDGTWETGAFDDGDGVREENIGEGEFIGYTATYGFGAGYTGTWAGSSFKDFLAGLGTQQYVAGSAMVEVDGAPAAPLTVSGPDPTETGIKIDLAQIAALAGDPDVANHTIVITYKTVVEDAFLGSSASGEFTELVLLTVGAAAGDSAACNLGEFFQGDFVSVARADARVSVGALGNIDLCEVLSVTFTVSNGTAERASNIQVTIPTTGDYEVIKDQTPTYTGDFDTNTPVYDQNLMAGEPSNPTITLAPAVELDGGGTITLLMRRRATAGTSSTPVTATVDFDDVETAPAGAAAFQNSGSRSPDLVRAALLNLTVTPDSLTVTGTTAQWSMTVVNAGAGVAYGATLTDVLPTGLTPNAMLTDAANTMTGLTSSVSGQTVTWDLGDMAVEAELDIVVVVDISGTNCTIADGANSVTAAWGCGDFSSQASASNDPNFAFLASELLVLHDASNSSATICQATGELVLEVRSSGSSSVLDITVIEDLVTASSGLSFVPGSSMYRLEGGMPQAIIGAPTVTPAGEITWTSANIPPLAELVGVGADSGENVVYISFNVEATETANVTGGAVSASASGSSPCGDAAASPGETFEVPLVEPNITVAVTGENVTNSTAVDELVTGAPGDTVRWSVEVSNSATRTAQNVQFLATFPGSGTTSGTLRFPSAATATVDDGTWITIDDIPAAGTVTYTVEYVLGSNCVDDGMFEAQVTWGCNAAAAASANLLSSPSENTDTATLDMEPDFTGSGLIQSVTALSNARAEIAVTLANRGGVATSLVLDEVLTGFEYDSTFTPTVTGDLTLGGVTLVGASAATPRFTLTGSLLAGESAILTFRVVPTQGFDVLSDPLVDEEVPGDGDSAATANGTSQATINYVDPCSGSSSFTQVTSIDPNVPDLDLLVDVGSIVVEDGESYTFDFTIRNNGERSSLAENIVFTPTLGAGWTMPSVTLVTPGIGGTAGVCGATCTELQIGSLVQNGTALIRITATANDNGSSLQIQGDVTGSLYQNDGTDTGNDYSLDSRRPAVVGVTFSSTITGTSETFTGEGDDPRKVAVGEEVTYRIDGRWFGSEPLSALEIKDTLPTGIGFVSAADVASTMSFNVYAGASGTTAPSTGDTGEIRFVLADIGSGIGTFSADLVGRILNVDTADATALVNPVGMTFDLLGLTFHSNNAADGYSGDQGDADLHAEQSVAVQRAVLEVTTGVRNVTQGQMTYSLTTMGDAGDVLEYETVVTNTGSTAAFDVVLEDDPVSAKLLIVDGAADSIDNDGDSATDEADEGTFVTGAGGTVTFDGTDNSALDQLDPMDAVTFLYRVTVASTVQPDETLTSGAAVEGASLDAVDGNQTGTAGTLGATIGSEELTGDASADFEADMIDLTKVLVTTSEGADTSTDVVVGEILQYRVAVVLPEGTVPTFKVLDSLDEGLSLVGTPATTFGWAPAPAQPSITPGVLPGGGSPLAVEWDFGSLTVPAGTDAQRTVTLEYFVQVENVAGNVGGQTLANSARYMFDTTTGMGSTVTVTVREPGVSVTLAADAATPTDAGARVTYTVVATSNGDTTAQDLGFVFTLPAGTTYVASSTMPTSGPVIGEPEVAVGSLTWGRQQAMPGPQDLDLVTTGGSNVLEFEFQIELGDSVEPEQEIDGALAVTWTSLDGATGTTLGGITAAAAGTALGERDGSSGSAGLNDYVVSDTTDSAAARAYANRVTASGDTVTGGGFRVGDVVTYTVEVDLQEGTVDDLTIEDTLPSGLEFVSFDAITPATGSNGFTFTAPSGANAPSAGDTGSLAWNLGTVVNAGDNVTTNDTLTLVYRARVLDTGGLAVTPTSVDLDDAARITYDDAAGNAEAETAVVDTVTVKQPLLTSAYGLAAGQATTVETGDAVRYTITATNGGDAPAYNTALTTTLPTFLRDATPTVVAATLAGAPVTLAAPVYDSMTGVATWTLADGQVLDVGALAQLVVTFEATVDADAGAGSLLTASGRVGAYGSKPSADATERRTYASTALETAQVGLPTPTGLTKASSVTGAAIGEEFTYTITVPGTAVNASLYDVGILDTLPDAYTLVSATSNAAALGAVFTDSSSGQSLSYGFDEIPSGAQAAVTLTVRFDNESANQDTAEVVNTASFTYASSDGGTQSSAISGSAPGVDVTESILAVDKAFNRFEIADAMQGLQAGDRVIYDIEITNSGDAPAFDIVLDDLAAEQLINPVVTAAPDSPGAPTLVGTTAGVTTYRWNIAGPIAASGGTYAFELSLELDVTVQPMEMLTNGAAITWTSLAGTSAFERSGDDGEGAGLNNYAASENAPVTITTGTVLFTKVEDSAGDGTYAPGEVIEYDLSFSAGQGTIQDVRLRDELPAGLVVVSSTLVANGYQRPGGGAVTLISGPVAGATGTLDYDIGDIESTMASPTIELTLRAYVDDVPGNTAATDLTNSAELFYDDPANPGSDISVTAQTAPVVGVVEPSFGLTLDAPATGGLGVTQDFELRVENQGDGAAWQPTVQLQLPLGMRDYDPLGDTFTVSVEGGRNVALTLGVDYTVTYNPLTGDLVLMLTGTGGFIGDDEELVIDWRGQVDENAVDGASLQPIATLTEAFSADTSSGNPDGLRTYTNAFGSGTQGTGNGVAGDDATDNAAMSAGVPVLAVTKSVDNAVAEAGTFLHYQITITNTGSVDSGASTLIDDLDPVIASGSTQNVLLVPAAGTVVVNQTGGVNGTGQVRVDGLVVAAGTSVTLDFDTGIRRPLPNGVVVENQASLTVPFFGNPFLSDSTNPADDDAVEAGNDPAILSDDDPTRTVIGARPEITIAKVDADPSGAPLESGDEILYTLTFDNGGNETGVNAVLTDSIPGNTTYVPGSTTLNNVPVADVGGTSPLVSGLVIQSPGAAAGTLDVDSPGTVTFRVTLDAGLQPGTIITNQATVVVDGIASGTQPPFSSDDPDTGADGDATRSIVGDVASVDATKTVVDVNGGTADPGDVLVYRIEALNSGGGDATGVILTDSIPVGTTLVASSMSYDADGGGPGGATALTDAVDGDLADAGGTQPGAITLLRGDLAGGESFALEFQVTIDAGATGAVVNQGVISRDGAPDESTDADGNDDDGDQPTTLGIGSTPILRLTKDVMDLDGGVLEPGDRLRYVLLIENIGSGDAEGVTVLDPIAPVGTTYVTGSTVLDGVPLADTGGGDSSLVAGVAIGTIEPGRQATITVDVEVAAIVAAGTVITNQANYVSSNAGTGTSDSNFDDGIDTGNDAGDGNDDDPTVITLGGGGSIASVSGDVWLDADHDRVFSPPGFGIGRGSAQDQPLGGWTVEVLLGGSVIATTTSGIDGGWGVTGLLPGPGYAVRFRHPVTGTIFGNPVSTFPGATTDNGEIAGLLLAPGGNIVGQSLPLDPSGVAYNSVTRMPVEGTAVVIEGPAGFDELIHLPPGQQGQVTAPDGYYQFDLLAGFPAGVYTLTFTPPVGYLPTFPSGILPPQAGPLDPTGGGDPFLVASNNGAPTGGDPTDYFVSFDLAPGDPNVVNNHVALDPVLEGSIAISKRTPKRNVVRGELVPYTLEVRNLLSVPLPGMEVIDILPPGFKYIAGSAQVDGLNIEPDVTGRQLVWPGITFTPGQVREISLVTVIGAGVGDGRYVNTARAIEPFSRTLLSNVAEAEIYVVPDPIFDCTDIIGKVFDDRNGDGYQDEGEPGLPGVRLRTVRGLVVTTDAYGRYHIACPELAHDLRGSNFIVKVDERSLPTGYRMTSENPRVIRLTRGKIVEADFGAAISRVLRLELADGAFVRSAGTDEKADREALDEGWIEAFRMVFEEVEGGRAVLRLGYVATDEPRELIDIRLANALEAMEGLWNEKEGRAPLEVEREVLRIARAERPAEVGLDGVARNVEAAEADERGIAPPASLSLDGVQPGGIDDAPGANAQRRADVALSAADIRVQADGLQVNRQLNVVASPNSAPRSGELVFSTWCNYGAFVERSELRIFADDASASGEPLRVVPMGAAGVLRMAAAELDGDRFLYVLRAYGGEGRFDETEPKVLRIVPDTAFSMEAPLDPTELLVGYGESHLARADIPVQGGSVTVSGREVPEGARVFVGGQEIPVTDEGVFVTQLILGEGTHDVAVRLDGVDGTILDAERRVMFPKDEWFFVAIADLTVGGGSTSGPAALVTGDDQYDDDVWVNGRVAMHLKGKIKGEHLLTMSFDTGDRPLDEIFDGLDDRDPRTLLRYVDPDQTYPVYGDDSTTSWDAPTQGRFYVRLERDDYKVLWGNFKTQILDTDLAQIDRGLYGFQGQYRSRARTESGEIRTTLDGFAAAPDSAAAREELRGTGGSLYYLRHRDLMIGSERVRIEVRDKDSGLVLDVQNLTPQQDYDVDYLAGRILLTSPLASTAADGFAVQNSSLAGNPVYLVARYEFTPSGTDLDALDVGGRVSHWMSDSVRVGLTIDHREETGGDRDLQAVDVTWRFGGNSYLKAEVANSEGPGSEELTSLDGGFTYGSAAGGLNDGSDGSAARIEGAFDLKESGIGFLEGRLTGMVQRREAGFSGTGQSTQGASTQASLSLTEPLGEKTSLRVEFDMRDEDLRTSQRAVDAQLEHQINEEWGLLAGLRLDDVDAGVLSGLGARNGRRADLGLRLEYGGFERGSVYVFGQATVDRTGGRRANNRYGIGGDYVLTEKLKVDGELSGGNGGVGVRVGTELSVTDRTDLYLAYGLDADRSDTGLGAQTGRRNGTLTAGAKHRYSETLSLFGEERYQHGDGPAGLTHAYGAEYSPNDRWTGGLLMENGQLSEGGETTIERTGVSINAGYVKEKTRVASAVEWRDDEIAGGDRTTWLTRNTIGYQTTPDWRMLAGVDIARSDSENGSTFDADYTELTLGWAHRPVDHERWNALFRYSYHEDLPSPGQVGAFGGGVDFAQRSHVLSADANYDVSRWVTVGGKVGVRHGELKPTRDAGVWFDSTAVLYALRADLHVVKKWDALLEARFLDVEAAEDQRAGVLASVSRHVGENGKIGVGYNFADFSDNLTDLDYDHQGWFFNLVGKF